LRDWQNNSWLVAHETRPEIWLNLQKPYELRLAEAKAGATIRHLPRLGERIMSGARKMDENDEILFRRVIEHYSFGRLTGLRRKYLFRVLKAFRLKRKDLTE